MDFKSPWAEELDCAITVCDTECIVTYQNARSLQINGNMGGKSIIPCHNDHSREIIHRLLTEGGRNVYTIDKRSVHKLIYQTAWLEQGAIRGLVEFSMEIPVEMPNFDRSTIN